MTNHVHALLKAPDTSSLSLFSHFVQRRYAYYYSKKHKWSGAVFQRMYKGLHVDKEAYLLECGRYIERNPLRAGMVKRLEDYPYSSFHYYAYGQSDDLLEPSPAFLALSEDPQIRRGIYRQYVKETRVQEEMFRKGLLRV